MIRINTLSHCGAGGASGLGGAGYALGVNMLAYALTRKAKHTPSSSIFQYTRGRDPAIDGGGVRRGIWRNLPSVGRTNMSEISFEHVLSSQYTVFDGLGGMHVEDIYQDRQGFLWIATADGGVSRFDSARFDTFGLKDWAAESDGYGHC